jgi:hypothetical protein
MPRALEECGPMSERERKAVPAQALLLEFDAAVEFWHHAELEVHAALARFRTGPNPVNRLAVLMAWAALQGSLRTLSGFVLEHPPAFDAVEWMHGRSEVLQLEVQDVAGVEEPIDFD